MSITICRLNLISVNSGITQFMKQQFGKQQFVTMTVRLTKQVVNVEQILKNRQLSLKKPFHESFGQFMDKFKIQYTVFDHMWILTPLHTLWPAVCLYCSHQNLCIVLR